MATPGAGGVVPPAAEVPEQPTRLPIPARQRSSRIEFLAMTVLWLRPESAFAIKSSLMLCMVNLFPRPPQKNGGPALAREGHDHGPLAQAGMGRRKGHGNCAA